MFPIEFGNGPISWLKPTSKTVTFVNSPISSGKQDLNPLSKNIISFNVLDILPMLAGKHPWKLLFASTITETGELPKLSGRSKRNRLWFMKMASSGLSNSSLGTVPSNSLKRRSRYLREGNLSTTVGNLPAKRLLLKSSSNRSFRFSNLRGTVPQKRLELR